LRIRQATTTGSSVSSDIAFSRLARAAGTTSCARRRGVRRLFCLLGRLSLPVFNGKSSVPTLPFHTLPFSASIPQHRYRRAAARAPMHPHQAGRLELYQGSRHRNTVEATQIEQADRQTDYRPAQKVHLSLQQRSEHNSWPGKFDQARQQTNR
jgi:hypothetical protein